MRLLRRMVMGGLGLVLALTLVACGLHIANSGQSPLPPPGQGLRIATHNVHYILRNASAGKWSVPDWERRKAAQDAAFKALDADIVAFQEMETFAGGDDDSENLARGWLLAQNPGYGAAAVGDWRSFPSTQPIFYRRDRFNVVDQGWFFFSDTPDVIYSRTFNGSYPAFASWAEFEEIGTRRRFHVFNMHFEYKSRANRLASASLVRDRMAPVIGAGGPVFLAGDLNALAGSATLGLLEEAGLTFAPVKGATYHLDLGLNLFGAIDHVAAAGPVEAVGAPVVLRQDFGGVWPSDHYPVVTDYRLIR
jgi:endonuclease/exonuclease/phosphatase family metal-dependent hydrolase